jgi:hypothetical protein
MGSGLPTVWSDERICFSYQQGAGDMLPDYYRDILSLRGPFERKRVEWSALEVNAPAMSNEK